MEQGVGQAVFAARGRGYGIVARLLRNSVLFLRAPVLESSR
jgi:hypothetical protein